MTYPSSPFWEAARTVLRSWKRNFIATARCLMAPRGSLLRFQCNICSKHSSFPRHLMGRETTSCRFCGSTVRWRSVIHALSLELFAQSLTIAEFPHRPDLAGIGLSDWDGYAKRLAARLSYTNTFFHQEPRLDITSINPDQSELYDFIISTDVFEHICQPVSKAFRNAFQILKPNGIMIFTVPYREGETQEHFPDVCEFSIKRQAKTWVLVGKTAEGNLKKFTDLTFHGGPGTVVECRLFGKDSLLQDCKTAGFDPVRIHAAAEEKFGIIWNIYIPEQAPYRPLIYGLDTPPWALVKP